MLRGWFDTCIVCAKPDGQDTQFGHVRFVGLRDTLLGKKYYFAIR